MASRASLILLLTATLTASSLAAAYEGPDQGQPWANHPAVAPRAANSCRQANFDGIIGITPITAGIAIPTAITSPTHNRVMAPPTGDRYRGATTPISRPMNPDPITVRPAIGELLGITAAR